MTHPKFTVVTPTYNQGQFIEKTIDSVLSQGYPNLEFIIIDGGSTDNTVEIIKRHERHLAFWVSEKDRGQSHAINKGMLKATGEYLTWLNSDDWFVPGAMENIHKLFTNDPDIGMIVGSGRLIDEHGAVINKINSPAEITLDSLYHWMHDGNFLQPATAFKKSAWVTAGQINENIHMAMDLDLWLRMAKAGVKFGTTDIILAEALSHPNAKTTAYKEPMRLDIALVIIRHGGEHVVVDSLNNMVARLTWYHRNYEAISRHPIIKFLRPIIKRFSKEGEYWSNTIPPWVKE